MARPRSTGKSTSFGKQTDAEKSFRSRKKDEKRFDSERPKKSYSSRGEDRPRGEGRSSRFGSADGERKSYGRRDDSSSERPKRYSKPFEKRGEGSDRPYSRPSSKPFGEKRSFNSDSDRPKRFTKGPFEKRSDKPFGERKERFSSDKPRFSKEGDDKRPRRDDRSFGSDKPFGERKGRFSSDKPRFSKEGDDKRPRRDTRSFDSDKPRSFSKPFAKRDDEKPFRKSFSGPRDGDDAKPARRSSRPFDESEERPKKFSRADVVKKGAKPEGKKSFADSKLAAGPAPERPEYKEKVVEEGATIRLNKFMANSGVGSRREADEYIKMGLVTVNGVTITEMGHKVKMTDDVRYEGRRLKAEKPVYILLNKPKGFITTTDDPQERNTVMNLVANAGKERIYPVGRLDRNTTGLLLLTNDGDLADKLTHPSYKAKKIYKATLDKPITKADFIKIQEGVYLEEGRAIVDDLAMVDETTVGIELHIGWNRIVRRIFESLGYVVEKLDRVVYAGLDKKDLGRGQWRFLKPEEVVKLKHFK